MAMKRKYHRTGFTASQSAELWERWKRGEGLTAIGRVLGKGHTSIWQHIKPSGGIRPPARRRSARSLSLAEREEISRGIVEGRSVRSIATTLGRSASMCQSRGQSQRRIASLSGRGGRQTGMETGVAPKALQVGDLWPVAASCGSEARDELVARADRGLAKAGIPKG